MKNAFMEWVVMYWYEIILAYSTSSENDKGLEFVVLTTADEK
jgi:hypothetical protein